WVSDESWGVVFSDLGGVSPRRLRRGDTPHAPSAPGRRALSASDRRRQPRQPPPCPRKREVKGILGSAGSWRGAPATCAPAGHRIPRALAGGRAPRPPARMGRAPAPPRPRRGGPPPPFPLPPRPGRLRRGA